jgi:hypothetical protein
MKIIPPFLFAAILLSLSLTSARAGDVSAAGDIFVEAGKSWPNGPLQDWIGPGNAYRAHLFGGAHLQIPFVNAVGLGLDFTYAHHDFKQGSPDAYYRRYLWDWLFIPISIGYLQLTPGMAWVATDVKNDGLGIDRTSIRPAGVFTAALRIPVVSIVMLRTDFRTEIAFADHAQTTQGGTMNLTGSFWSWFGGIEAEF